MVLDVLIRHVPSTLYATVGRSFFTPADSRPLPNAAEVWQGYYQSARPTVGMYYKEKRVKVFNDLFID
jgi:eukaryotic translation initiation factor 2C